MNANELRIGNWVLTPDGSVQITDIFNGGINLSDDKYEAYPDYSMDRVSPIPLTPEILEAAGFKEDDEYFELGFMCLKYDGLTFLPVNNETGWATGRAINYVHQLQNLCFALCHEELTINLTEKVNV
jgi:hypothetical protein